MTRDEVERCTILRCLVGSTVHGINIGDGLEDRDEMGVCIEPITAAMGVHAPFEQFIYRSAAEREGRHDAPSTGGDLDLTIYSLRKYVRLALKGNPTVLLLLFAPKLSTDSRGGQLRDLAPEIVSRAAGGAFLGYLHAQRQRLTGERGGKGVNRNVLVETYGFDVKFAVHMLRLGYQGVELLTTGRLVFPIAEPIRSFLLSVRGGHEDINTCLTRAGELEAQLKDLLETSILPEQPNTAVVDAWVTQTYLNTWSARRPAGGGVYGQSAQSCGCDGGAGWICERHSQEARPKG